MSSGWWTWALHNAAEEAAPEPVAAKKKRLKPGVTLTAPHATTGNIYWHAVANGRIVADGGEGYASKQKALQGLRAAAKVISAHLAKLDRKRG